MRFGLTLSSCKLLWNNLRSLFLFCKHSTLRVATTTPAEAVRLFIRFIDQGRYDDAVRFLPETLVRALGVERLEAILFTDSEEVRERGGISSIDVMNDSGTLQAAEVNVNIHYRDGSSDTEHILLMNEEGEWKIDMTP